MLMSFFVAVIFTNRPSGIAAAGKDECGKYNQALGLVISGERTHF